MKISYLKYLIVYLDNSFVDLPNKFTNKEQIVLDLVNTKDTILQTQHATTEIKLKNNESNNRSNSSFGLYNRFHFSSISNHVTAGQDRYQPFSDLAMNGHVFVKRAFFDPYIAFSHCVCIVKQMTRGCSWLAIYNVSHVSRILAAGKMN